MSTHAVNEAMTRVEMRISVVSPCVVATAARTCCFDASPWPGPATASIRPASASFRLQQSYQA